MLADLGRTDSPVFSIVKPFKILETIDVGYRLVGTIHQE
jgi:hypothetical protein